MYGFSQPDQDIAQEVAGKGKCCGQVSSTEGI
jgi:hypothetical protein